MSRIDIKLEFKTEGFQEVLNSEGTKAAVRATAESIANRVGWGVRVREFTTTRYAYGPRPATSVWTRGKTERQARHLEQLLKGAL